MILNLMIKIQLMNRKVKLNRKLESKVMSKVMKKPTTAFLMTTRTMFLLSRMKLKAILLPVPMVTTMVTTMMMTLKMMRMAIFRLFQREVVSHFAKFTRTRKKRSQRKIKRKHFGVLLLVEMVFSLLVCTCSPTILFPRLGCIPHH